MEVSKCWKIVEFLKISIKKKNCKTLSETQTAMHLHEIIQPSPNPSPSDKTLLRLWHKSFLTEIYRNIQTFAFKVPQECSSWASINEATQIFLWHQTETCLLGNFLSERFLAALRDHITFNVKRVEFHKMSEVLWAKLYCKMNDLID